MNLTADILSSMVLAPSAHNTQPWQFRVGEQQIDIVVDEARHLAVSDPTGRQTYVSLGCAIMNGIVAAAHQGQVAQVAYLPEQGVAARVTFVAGDPNQHVTNLCRAIEDRRTDRSIFDGTPLDDSEQEALKATYDAAVHVATKQREAIAELAAAGTVSTLQRADFKEELSHWVRNNWTKQPDGMPGYAMGMPAPISLLAPFMVKVAPIHKQEGPKTREQVASASLIAVIATEGDTKADWLKAGELVEQLWLEATAAGLAASIITAPIEAGDEFRTKLQQIIGTERYPQTMIRLGHSKQTNLRATPRRSVEDCLI
mgnify:CR=1 FL=1